MVGFEDSYDLYMGGSKLEKGAYNYAKSNIISELDEILKSK